MSAFECKDCKFTAVHLESAIDHAYRNLHTLEKENADGCVVTVSVSKEN